MGYTIQTRIFSIRALISTSLIFCLVLCFFPVTAPAAIQEAPPGIPPGHWDHVIITDTSMVSAFAHLAKQRRDQGLRCRIVPLHVVQKWSGRGDLMQDIRFFVEAASRDWGTRYVLLGGDAEVIPVPLGHAVSLAFSWDIPMDLYYAAPNGEWDADGDGILGEYEDDAPDLTPIVALGRAPVADCQEARSFVDKVIAFESGCPEEVHNVLLVAEVGSPYPWFPGLDVHHDLAWDMEALAEILTPWWDVGDFQRLYQNWEDTPGAESLSRATFLDALNTGDHRFLGMFTHANEGAWSLGGDLLRQEQLDELEAMDHSLFMGAQMIGGADCREDGMLETLLIQPVGGCSGAVAPSAMFYLSSGKRFFEDFWQRAADESCGRVGDAFQQTMVNQWEAYSPSSFGGMVTLQSMTIVGDPALLFLPVVGNKIPPRHGTKSGLFASASPNPFNPSTEISFEVPGDSGTVLGTIVDIHDLAGRRLVRILDAGLEAGPHSVLWQGRDSAGRSVGSGLFFARIRAGDFQSVVKLVLVE